jgi:hypothetical protein
LRINDALKETSFHTDEFSFAHFLIKATNISGFLFSRPSQYSAIPALAPVGKLKKKSFFPKKAG